MEKSGIEARRIVRRLLESTSWEGVNKTMTARMKRRLISGDSLEVEATGSGV